MGTVPSTHQQPSSDEEYVAAMQASSAAIAALNTRIYSAQRYAPFGRDLLQPEEGPEELQSEPEESPTHSDDGRTGEVVASSEPQTNADTRWRKYGCKQIRSTQDYRNYYRCSVKGCSAKRIEHVQFTAAGAAPITKTEMRGQHTHLNQMDVKKMKMCTQEDFRALLQRAGDGASDAISSAPPELPAFEPSTPQPQQLPSVATVTAAPMQPLPGQLVVVASGEVDPSDDGWQWRKYGQKQVKDSAFPRSYYRCSTTSCPARKKIQCSPTQRFITYESQHNHPAPSAGGNKKRRKAEPAVAQSQML